MRQFLLAALFSLFAVSAMAQGGSNMCSYPPVTTPVIGSDCWPVNQNGITKTMTATQFFKNAIQGPSSSGNGNAAIFSGMTGTALSDAGAPPALFAADIVALAGIPVTVMPVTQKVRVGTYSLASGIYSPPIDYYLTGTACAIDAGSCIASATVGKYWHITPQTLWDPRWWGAYGDTQFTSEIITVSSGNCAVGFTKSHFSPADKGKLIVLTALNNTATLPAGNTYTSTIAAYNSPTSVTVQAPCPAYNSSVSQFAFWGHDDSTALNNQIAFMGSNFIQGINSMPQINGGGLAFGACASSVNVNTAVELSNLGIVALCAANMPVASSGVLTLSAPNYSGASYVEVDSAFLPVNGIYETANGTTRWHHVRVFDWFGHGPVTTLTGTSVAEGSVTGSISGCNGSAPFTCTMSVTAGSGNLQAGYSLSDTSGGIPAGTYVQTVMSATPATVIGSYQVYNAMSSPAVGSETIVPIGMRMTFVAGPTPVPGLIAAGNSGVADRTMIVAVNGNSVTLNKAPATPYSAISLNFYQDPNGIYANGASAGFHLNNSLVGMRGPSGSVPGNRYGCALLSNAGGQSAYLDDNFSFGVANICIGPLGRDNEFRGPAQLGGSYATGSNELDIASVIIMDGAAFTQLKDMNIAGQVQSFTVTSASPPELIVDRIGFASVSGQGFLAPNNFVWIYTEQAATSPNFVITMPGNVITGSNVPYFMALTVGQSGSWADLSTPTLIGLGQTYAPMMSYLGASPLPIGQGVSLLGSGLYGSEFPILTPTGAATFSELQSGSAVVATCSGSCTLTLPNTIGWNVSHGGTAFHLPFVLSRGAGTATVTMLSGGTLCSGSTGSPVCTGAGSLALTLNVPYSIICPENPSGTAARCYIWAMPN